MSCDHPQVSVCLPTYNGAQFVRFAIESVLNQSYSDFELIVSDDASTDGTLEIVSDVRDERLRVYRNTTRLGLVGNWNRCISLAQGRYITLLHQDDVMHPENLRRKIEALDRYPSAGFAYSNIQRIDAEGTVVGGHWLSQPESDAVFSSEQVFRMIAFSGNPISCPSVVVRQECYQRLGLFDARLPFAADLEMWMRIAAHYDVIYLAEPLIYQRIHPEQETARFQGTGRDYQDVLRALDIVRLWPLSSDLLISVASAYKTLSKQAFQMARWKIRQGRISIGVHYSLVAITALQRSINTTHRES